MGAPESVNILFNRSSTCRDDIYLLRALEDPIFLVAYSSRSSSTPPQANIEDKKFDGVLSSRSALSADLYVIFLETFPLVRVLTYF